MSDLSVSSVSGTKITPSQENDITPPPLNIRNRAGALPCSNIHGHKVTENITLQPEMLQAVDNLRKVARPEQGAFFTDMIATMKAEYRPMMVGQMVRCISQSPLALTECLASRSLRRAFIAELRNPIYHACAEIQAFRNKLLIQHYQCERLRGDVEHEEAFNLLKTLPAEQLLDLQVAVNQVAETHRAILGRLTELREFSRLIGYAKLHAGRFPHIFINTNKQEILCLSEIDFQCFKVVATPKEPQLIRYNRNVYSTPEIIPAKPEDLSEMRSSIPLLKTRWKSETFSWRSIILFIFSHREGLSYQDNLLADLIGEEVSLLLSQHAKKKMNLVHRESVLRKLLSPYCGEAYQKNCEKLVDVAREQLSHHPYYSSIPSNQQGAIAAIALIKLLVELSTPKYCGFEDNLAKGLMIPAMQLFRYAYKTSEELFTNKEKQVWKKALMGEGLTTEHAAQAFLSRINNYQFPVPHGPEIKKIIDDFYPQF